ncbi:MAG: hypothetical protein Q4D55_06480 [Eubacteriales bacterium]|nr:hypothetical protein [Eubacteriales bacterium]
MRRLRELFLGVLALLHSIGMFYCFVAGAGDGREGTILYMAAAGIYSLLIPMLLNACFHYIYHLQKELEKYKGSGS